MKPIYAGRVFMLNVFQRRQRYSIDYSYSAYRHVAWRFKYIFQFIRSLPTMIVTSSKHEIEDSPALKNIRASLNDREFF